MSQKNKAPILLLMVLSTLPWLPGCGQSDQAASPQKAEEFRLQQIERTERMQREASQRK
jgi:hypothetical protein